LYSNIPTTPENVADTKTGLRGLRAVVELLKKRRAAKPPVPFVLPAERDTPADGFFVSAPNSGALIDTSIAGRRSART
jgi:hypothetical protein